MMRMTGNMSLLWSRFSGPLLIFPLLCLWQTPLGLADAVKVYRCRGEDGAVEFRQWHCEQGSQQEVRVDTTPSGWVPASVSPESKRTRRAGRSRSEPASRGGNRAAESKRKQEKECWRVKKRLDKLEWRMRRGYKAGKGPGMRRQRRDYEDYLRKFC